jgi:hypothetical protein
VPSQQDCFGSVRRCTDDQSSLRRSPNEDALSTCAVNGNLPAILNTNITGNISERFSDRVKPTSSTRGVPLPMIKCESAGMMNMSSFG